eukprot:TRINITY_DN31553_c0_g1_i1.p1 TRINITY_DN31553_c0_g1~~TRINITY_DN31553_c0_g1_i1.p1  ORF type:complete len:484 (+),score=124.34 TRINITY_DN31553_c0_g1_i1:54-1454(+)
MASIGSAGAAAKSTMASVPTPVPSERHILDPKEPRSMTIVLTGGPCSGKSTILALIRDRLSKRGMQVLTVPEYATHFFANSDGFQGEWVATEKEDKLQDILLRFQIMQENMFHEYGALNKKSSVLLLDRAVMDQKVFVSSDKVWEFALTESNLTEAQLLSRYDMVMHLGTCAKHGDYQWGPGSNNPGRYHSPEEAAKLDDRCKEVYSEHKQLRMVPHAKSFEDKVEQVMKYLEDALGCDGLAGKRQRVNVSARSFPDDIMRISKSFVITSTYLDQAMHQSLRRRRTVTVDQWREGLQEKRAKLSPDCTARASTPRTGEGKKAPVDEEVFFEERRSIPDEHFLARRVLHEAEYHSAVQLATASGVDKHVLSFQVGAIHYELCYFQGGGGSLVLDFPIGAQLPDWLEAEPAAEVRFHPAARSTATAPGAAAAAAVTTGRKTRVLRKNSTEEAAVEYMRQSGDKSLIFN